jgi:hypothetical protein
MVSTSVDWQKVRLELARKRRELFDRFVKNPADISLAREIRLLDDQMVRYSEHVEHERTQ